MDEDIDRDSLNDLLKAACKRPALGDSQGHYNLDQFASDVQASINAHRELSQAFPSDAARAALRATAKSLYEAASAAADAEAVWKGYAKPRSRTGPLARYRRLRKELQHVPREQRPHFDEWARSIGVPSPTCRGFFEWAEEEFREWETTPPRPGRRKPTEADLVDRLPHNVAVAVVKLASVGIVETRPRSEKGGGQRDDARPFLVQNLALDFYFATGRRPTRSGTASSPFELLVQMVWRCLGLPGEHSAREGDHNLKRYFGAMAHKEKIPKN